MSSSKLLIIASVWPEPDSSAAGGRMMELIHYFKSKNYNITFACTAATSKFSFPLEQLQIESVAVELNHSSFDVFIKNVNPEIVLFDRFMVEEQFGWRVAENVPDAIRILDTEDLHCLRYARQKALQEKRTFTTNDLFSDHAKREIASIFRCDLSLIVSEYEMELLAAYFKVPTTLLFYLPLIGDEISDSDFKKNNAYSDRANFIFIGNFYHEPNIDAVFYLKKEIWPLIRQQLPQTELFVYGAYLPPKIEQLNHKNEGFIIKGRAENTDSVFQTARVNLAPLRFGAGQKGKLIDGMKNGLPSVTTSIGAEGINGLLSWNGFICNETSSFSNAAVLLYSSEAEWTNLQKNGLTIINSRFRKELFLPQLDARIAFLKTNLQQHRINNFTGSMLQHHTLHSTKYMSRFIEEKNKKN